MKKSKYRKGIAFLKQKSAINKRPKKNNLKSNWLVMVGILVGAFILFPEGVDYPSIQVQLPQVQNLILPQITSVVRAIVEFNFYQ